VKAVGPLAIFVFNAACSTPADLTAVSEENYGFLAVTSSPCTPKIGARNKEADCQRLTEARRFRGTWLVGFETSLFSPIGQQDCVETKGLTQCAELVGKALPWPSRWACPRRFQIEFVGRRNAFPALYGASAYQIIVDKVISAKRLADPPSEPGDCDRTAP
jgi:hypothetical protein